jgi:hypothetical protein
MAVPWVAVGFGILFAYVYRYAMVIWILYLVFVHNLTGSKS